MEQDKIYVIRHLSFFYTDEWYKSLIDYTDHTGHITDLFYNKEDAISKWKQLEYSFSHKVDFYNILYCEYSDGDDTDDQKELLAQKSVDELFEIIQKRECHVYGLYEYPKQLKQLVLFNKKSQQYDFCDLRMDDDVESNIFIPSNFIKDSPLNNEISPSIHDIFIEHDIDIKGTLEELSDTPLLLQCLIEENPDIKFYPPNSLKIQFKDLAQVNSLLKKPIEKEARYLSIEEIYQLEQQFNSPNPTLTTHQEDKLFAIWLYREQKYFGYKHILTYTHPDAFTLLGTYIFDNEVFIEGSLQDLSDTPNLLKTFIENNAGYFEYRSNPIGIFIESADVMDFSYLLALNTLLKQPLFEIRQVTLEELNHPTEENQS